VLLVWIVDLPAAQEAQARECWRGRQAEQSSSIGSSSSSAGGAFWANRPHNT